MRYRRAEKQQAIIQGQILESAKILSEEVIASMLSDDEFFRRFTEISSE
ncbi:unannotated protein [freshwater metagenome]|uniref:Unannotated protein n=1 Tax=freshwater metagenome TaxID=449393 RepID=A0A6J7PDZ8_9ZZZZ